tara:strand:- start:4108 stop:4971 length:864 start_codon:yes stop_codon:yes gene_type:complete
MYLIINLLIFVVVLFLYIHINFQIKTSNYLEIYEVDNLSKDKLEELCDVKQPILINDFKMLENIEYNTLFSKYSDFDVKIKKRDDSIYLPIKLSTLNDVLKGDISNNYLCDNNEDFLKETTLIKEIEKEDLFLRPYNISRKKYNIILGSINSSSKLQYSLDFRNFFYIINGSVEITLCSPNNYKYLYVNKNYEDLQFESSINIYNVEEIYKGDFNKIKFLRVTLTKNKLLFIPPYWFYSIKILEDNTMLTTFKYRSFINSVAIMPHLLIQFLQNNNIKRTTTKILYK